MLNEAVQAVAVDKLAVRVDGRRRSGVAGRGCQVDQAAVRAVLLRPQPGARGGVQGGNVTILGGDEEQVLCPLGGLHAEQVGRGAIRYGGQVDLE
jgi:hypothetical protein